MSGVQLRPYQVDCLAAIKGALTRGPESTPPRRQRVLATLATGAGKTVIMSQLISDMKRGRALVLAHRDELIAQTVDKLRMVDRGLNVGIVKAQDNHYWADVIVASVQTLSQYKRLAQVGEFALIIPDEAHHSSAETYVRILTHLGAFSKGGPMVAGFTATPKRGDGVGLDTVFEEIVFNMPTVELIRQGYLCDVRGIQVHLEMDLSRVKTSAGDLVASQTGSVLMEANAPEHVAKALKQYAPDRKTLVFAPTVKVAAAMADACNAVGLPAAALDAKTPADARRRMLADLGRDGGRLRVIANVGVLTEGTDIPPVSCIGMARPTKSQGLYQQCLGRGLRPYPGKEDCIVLDFVGVSGRHQLQSAATLFGVSPRSLQGRTLTEALRTGDRSSSPVEASPARPGKLVAVSAQIYQGQQRVHWVKNGNDHFLLSIGDGMIALRPDGETWSVVHSPYRQSGIDETVLAAGLTLEYAQGVAEDRAREAGANRLIAPDAPWRALPVTSPQIYRLKQLRAWSPEITTRGEASDAITAAMAG